MKKKILNLSKTSIMHYIKLTVRTVFFLLSGILYLTGDLEAVTKQGILPAIIWIWYFAEMVMRLVPFKLESMGCEKVFKKYYKKPEAEREPRLQSWKRTLAVIIFWVILNGAFAALYFTEVVDKYFMGLIALAYGVGDIVCILFFCPFQTWFMKNRCCTTCRIYNWDFPMLVTPLLFIPHPYTYSLVIMALIILLRWEITYRRHPERFSERTNDSLRCKNCTEKLCMHKVQLKHFIKKNRDTLFETYDKVAETVKTTAKAAGEKTKETYDKVAETIKVRAEKAKETVKTTAEKAKETVKTTAATVAEKTKETYEKVASKAKASGEALAENMKAGIEEREAELRAVIADITEENAGAEKDESPEACAEEKADMLSKENSEKYHGAFEDPEKRHSDGDQQ